MENPRIFKKTVNSCSVSCISVKHYRPADRLSFAVVWIHHCPPIPNNCSITLPIAAHPFINSFDARDETCAVVDADAAGALMYNCVSSAYKCAVRPALATILNNSAVYSNNSAVSCPSSNHMATIVYKCVYMGWRRHIWQTTACLSQTWRVDDTFNLLTVDASLAQEPELRSAHATLWSLVLLCGTVYQQTIALRLFLCGLLP